MMTSTARARATVIEGRGPAFVNPGATIDICGARTGPSESVERTRRGTTTRVAAWAEELGEVGLDARESFEMVIVARDAEGGELGRGSIDVKALRDGNGRYARGGAFRDGGAASSTRGRAKRDGVRAGQGDGDGEGRGGGGGGFRA